MVDMIVQNVSEEEETNITFTIPRDDLEQCLLLVREVIGQSDGAALSYDAEIAKISVAGIGLRSHTGVGDKLFKALADNDINVLMVGTSEVRMTAIVKKDHAARAEEALKKSFAIQ